MTVATSCVVATVEADSPALPPRQLVELHVETTPSGVKVAVTGCGGNKTGRVQTNLSDDLFFLHSIILFCRSLVAAYTLTTVNDRQGGDWLLVSANH